MLEQRWTTPENGLQLDCVPADRPSAMTQQQLDRRRAARRRMDLPNAIQIRLSGSDGPSRPIIAKLVDASDGGVGVETFTRLRPGTRISVKANLHATDLSLALSGEGLVSHSREIGPGRYAVGLELQDVSYARAC
jgi:PilZ domain